VTWGLQKEFGATRVFNSPLAEANIVGRAIGMALRGLKPVVEIQFFDYIWPAYMQIRDELVTMRWRSGNDFSCPLVIRVAYGGYITRRRDLPQPVGRVAVHANPGLRVVCPATALDANGLLRTAIRATTRCSSSSTSTSTGRPTTSAEPGPDYMIPFGGAAVVREGDDVTVVTYGATVNRALQAARSAESGRVGRDPRPALAVTRRLGRDRRVGPKDEQGARPHRGLPLVGIRRRARGAIGEEHYTSSTARAPARGDRHVRRLRPELEDFILPQVADIVRAVEDLAAW
jgi:2-oxoisovalerate dehydrogenase E1 component